MKSPTVQIYNPLQEVLQHVVDQLRDAIREAGGEASIADAPGAEAIRSRAKKVQALILHVRLARRLVRKREPVVVVWPLLGWWELLLWRSKTPVFIEVHDPIPLRRQIGARPSVARLMALLGGRSAPAIVVLSPEAEAAVLRYFRPERVVRLPLPLAAPRRGSTTESNRILVLGQFKPSRDLNVMQAIGPAIRDAGWTPVVAGRGWPALAGWEVDDRFLSEDEFDDRIAGSAVLLLPYRYYFQSDVALRSLERGVPVVGRPTGFLRGIFGDNFPGAVSEWDDPESWVEAISTAIAQRQTQIDAATSYASTAGKTWAATLRLGSR